MLQGKKYFYFKYCFGERILVNLIISFLSAVKTMNCFARESILNKESADMISIYYFEKVLFYCKADYQ
jgi:hypothetical protein